MKFGLIFQKKTDWRVGERGAGRGKKKNLPYSVKEPSNFFFFFLLKKDPYIFFSDKVFKNTSKSIIRS